MRVLYFNREAVDARRGQSLWQREHNVVCASSLNDALAMMRTRMFDALVVDGAEDPSGVFIAEAQSLQPSLAVFVADESGDELASGLEEHANLLTMLEDDEFARVAAESRMRRRASLTSQTIRCGSASELAV